MDGAPGRSGQDKQKRLPECGQPFEFHGLAAGLAMSAATVETSTTAAVETSTD